MITRYLLLAVAAVLVLAGCCVNESPYRKAVVGQPDPIPDMERCRVLCPAGSSVMVLRSDRGYWTCGCIESPAVRVNCTTKVE